MVDSNQFRQVAENVFYRFEDQRYSIADEYGEHAYTSYKIKLLVYPMIKRTPCGAWIGLNFTHYPRQPRPYRPGGSYGADYGHICGKRFVNLQANKKFALPTIAEAAESYRARKAREIHIYEARIKGAKKHLEAMEFFLRRLPGGVA